MVFNWRLTVFNSWLTIFSLFCLIFNFFSFWNSSSSCEVYEDQVLSSLQTIFCVQIPGSGLISCIVSTYLQIFDESETLADLRNEDGSLDYTSLISDIISQVLVNINQGKQNSYSTFVLQIARFVAKKIDCACLTTDTKKISFVLEKYFFA